jgi:polysaccharide biosynthesis transport protein
MRQTGTGDSQGRARGSDDGERDLLGFALVIWRGKWIVAAVGALCAAVALAIGLTTPRTYEAVARLVVTPPKTAIAGDVAPAISMATYRALVENQSLAAKVVAEFKLGAAPYKFTADVFLRDSVSIETLRDTNVILIKVRLRDAKLTADVANRLANLAVELSQELNQDEIVQARDSIQTQVNHSREQLDELQARLEDFKKKTQVELLRKDAEATLGERGKLLQLLVEIQVEKARLAKAEEQLSARSRIDTVTRTIDQDPALMEAAKEMGGAQKGVLGLQLRDESLSQVYENLEQVVTASRTHLTGLEKQKAELVDVRRLDASQLPQLSRLYDAETELARLTLEYDLAKRVYETMATRLEETRLQVVGRSARLQTFDPALPPARPVAPHVVRDTALALIIGLILSGLGVNLIEVERGASTSSSS